MENTKTPKGAQPERAEKEKIMNKVYEVEYRINGGTATVKIRANSSQEAKRIAKQHTGCLIKGMRIAVVCGTAYRAAND